MVDGICTLANDYVFDQVVALLNSIEVNAGKDMPVCIYPYDDRVDKLKRLAEERPQVQVYDNQEVIERWDTWTREIWALHPTAQKQWIASTGKQGVHRMGTHRRFCAFEGPFDRFIYMDADTLLLSPPDPVFHALETVDWVTYDFQHKDLSHVFNVASTQLPKLFSDEQLKAQVFCSGFYGSKREIVTAPDIQDYLEKLSQGEAEVLYPMAPDQTILNYFVLRKPLKSVNFALTLPAERKTGNSVTSAHFEQQGNSLFDKGVRLLYLHYIGISSKLFTRLCNGENLDIRYRDIFLQYRYLHAPKSLPAFKGPLVSTKPQSLGRGKRLLKKLGLLK
ncbi:MAG: sugar transferase [Leptolyngbya sp. SIO1E4]|nr:sugar transferase [Leptolyngbya sp. SIO1E4]